MLRSIASSCTRRSVVSKSQSSVIFGQERSTARREFSSSSTDAEGQQDVPFNRVYTHPLSQVVLEHLQNVHGEWLMNKGLERGLTINRGKHVFLEFLPYNTMLRARIVPAGIPNWRRRNEWSDRLPYVTLPVNEYSWRNLDIPMTSRSAFPLTAVFVLASLLPSFFLFQTEVSAFSSLLIIPAMIAVEFGTCAFIWRFCSFANVPCYFDTTIMVRRPHMLIYIFLTFFTTALNEIMTNETQQKLHN